MDCPSEEQLIRMKLSGVNSIKKLDFDITNRTLTVFHLGDLKEIENLLSQLNLSSQLESTEKDEAVELDDSLNQKRILWSVLGINFLFFSIEMTTGLFSKSMGLVADSLDMLADSFVYGLSLLAVTGSTTRKKKTAKAAGYFQLFLAVIGIVEVLRRFVGDEIMPNFKTMIVVSIFALIANVLCLYLLQRDKSKEVHMQASKIFTSNDVIINTGVILAGVLVNTFNSGYPDLIIGVLVFIVVLRGSFRILNLAK
jgi:Co/Zn/Cd efflux system component